MYRLRVSSTGIYFDHMVKVNPTAQRLYTFMRERVARDGVMPTTREMAAHFGFRSHGAVLYHLAELQRAGLVRSQGRRWALRDVFLPDEIPVFGTIPAGLAVDAVEQADSTVRVDLASLGLRPRGPVFFLRVRGDSMDGARIFDGDLALLEQAEPRPGQVVAALIDGESTLKTYLVRRGVPWLRPENPKYPALIPARELTIQGVLLMTLRRQ